MYVYTYIYIYAGFRIRSDIDWIRIQSLRKNWIRFHDFCLHRFRIQENIPDPELLSFLIIFKKQLFAFFIYWRKHRSGLNRDSNSGPMVSLCVPKFYRVSDCLRLWASYWANPFTLTLKIVFWLVVAAANKSIAKTKGIISKAMPYFSNNNLPFNLIHLPYFETIIYIFFVSQTSL